MLPAVDDIRKEIDMISLETVNKTIGTDAQGRKHMQVSLNADTPEEVKAIGTDPATVEGMPNNAVIAPFSDAFTATKELLVLNSSGVWQ